MINEENEGVQFSKSGIIIISRLDSFSLVGRKKLLGMGVLNKMVRGDDDRDWWYFNWKKKRESWSHVGLIDIIRRLIRAGFFVSRGRYSGTKWITKIKFQR